MNRPVTRALATLITVCAVALALVGCTSGSRGTVAQNEVSPVLKQHEALENYVAAAQSQLPQLLEAFDGMYAEIAIDYEYSETIVYDYLYARQVDPKAARKHFKASVAQIQSACDSQVFPDMERAGIANPKARYTYFNADGSRIWSRTFSS